MLEDEYHVCVSVRARMCVRAFMVVGMEETRQTPKESVSLRS